MTANPSVDAFAPAKINLSLHVTGQRADGYHLLDSLVVFANFGDRLLAQLSDEPSLCVTGPLAEGVPTGPENLVLKAAALAGCKAAFQLEKNLPAAAGIGGGSSDAAATLRAISALTDSSFEMADLAALGADVPACYLARACRMSGIGERIEPVAGLPGLPAVLVNPGVSVHTPDVFEALKIKDGAPMPVNLPAFSSIEDVVDFLQACTRNDLEAPAMALVPEISKTLDVLSAQSGARLARMSGSGATCFALFDAVHRAEAAAENIAELNPAWWVQSVWLS